MVKVLYFSRMRTLIGKSEEDVALPQGVCSVADLIGFLAQQSAEHARAFATIKPLYVAVDCQYAEPDYDVADAREVAFFPAVSGG
ncbi:MAG: MoaD/ThiS family protein [Alphaproteobacteria bacterium GM202ARS2]|nr:MoaD/ThiS family protein [Alphaproteobacteria bacterium GM202ARS2]